MLRGPGTPLGKLGGGKTGAGNPITKRTRWGVDKDSSLTFSLELALSH